MSTVHLHGTLAWMAWTLGTLASPWLAKRRKLRTRGILELPDPLQDLWRPACFPTGWTGFHWRNWRPSTGHKNSPIKKSHLKGTCSRESDDESVDLVVNYMGLWLNVKFCHGLRLWNHEASCGPLVSYLMFEPGHIMIMAIRDIIQSIVLWTYHDLSICETLSLSASWIRMGTKTML